MITINKDSLANQDDTGESVAPSVGDVIDLGGVTAKVAADNGKTLDLDIETVNGQPVVGGADDAAGEPTTEDSLMAAAAAADKKAGVAG